MGEQEASFHVARLYTHMGSIVTDGGSIGEEIHFLCRSVAVVARPLRRKVFQNGYLLWSQLGRSAGAPHVAQHFSCGVLADIEWVGLPTIQMHNS